MRELIVCSFITISLIIGLILELITGRLFDKKTERIFIAALIIIILITAGDILDYLFSTQITLNNFRYVTSISGYILRPSVLAVFICILLRNNKNYFVIWLPIVLMAIVVISSPFNHLMFYFDANNVFHRGPLGFIVHIFSVVYMIIFMISTIRMYRIINKGEMITIFYIIVICVIGTSLETLFGLKFILSGAIAVSYAIYYMYVYAQIYKVDVMTSLLNRRSFDTDVRRMHKKSMIVVSIDMNDLKTLNDRDGHAAGDLAISTIAEAINKAAGKRFRVYRVGGDEFMALGVKQNFIQGEIFVKKVREELNKTEYSAAFGMSTYYPGEDFSIACEIADIKMYKDKKKLKEEREIKKKKERYDKNL